MTRHQIEVNVKGGLGNQFFGLAAGWAVAAETDSNLLVNGSNLKWRGSNRSRNLELDLFRWDMFPNEIDFKHTKNIPNFGQVGNRLTTKALQVIFDQFKKVEKSDLPKDFSQMVKASMLGKSLDGNYINFEWLDIAEKYGFPSQFSLITNSSKFANRIGETAVHVRLGDFLKYPNIFPIPSSSYYVRSLKTLESSNYEVFTDDEKHASEIYPDLLKNASKIITPSDLSGPDTFALLCRYPKIVTSPSTFSSVAAWSIGKNGGLVVCPERMTFSENSDSRPKNWIRINN